MTLRLTFDETGHPYMASRHPHSSFFIRTPEAKAFRVEHGRGRELLSRLPTDGPLFGVEVGVNEGYLSHHLLANRLDLTLWMVDAWPRGDNLIAYGIALGKTDFALHRRISVRMDSVEAAAVVPDGTMDFVFVDAGHRYESVVADIQAWRPKLKADGLLCGHDIHMGDVRRAVDELVPHWETGEDATWFAAKSEEKSLSCAMTDSQTP